MEFDDVRDVRGMYARARIYCVAFLWSGRQEPSNFVSNKFVRFAN